MVKNAKEQANALAKAIDALELPNFLNSEDITNVRKTLQDLMTTRGYTTAVSAKGSRTTRALTKKDDSLWRQYQSAKATEVGTQIERRSTTTYRWWRNDDVVIDSSHIATLEEHATDRIKQMVDEGYSSGDLHTCCGNDEVEYTGWWEVKED